MLKIQLNNSNHRRIEFTEKSSHSLITPYKISFEALKIVSLKNIRKNKYNKSLICASKNILFLHFS